MNDLNQLTSSTIETLKDMPRPIVRVCGPLTTGGLGYEENARRLRAAEDILKEKGMNVFVFDDAEKEIKDKGYDLETIMKEFHEPILNTGLIEIAFFLPGWEHSDGATWERNFIEGNTTMSAVDFPEEWFPKNENGEAENNENGVPKTEDADLT